MVYKRVKRCYFVQPIEKMMSSCNIPGSWFLPNGSKIPSSINNTQSLHVALGNQTVGLNITNSVDLPTGIYHCEMMDRNNNTHHLYAGIYPENEGIIILAMC